MKYVIPGIRALLLQNAALVTLVGKDKDNKTRIYGSEQAPYAREYPRITMFEVTNYDSDFSDDEACAAGVVVQVDVWAKTPGFRSAIARKVNETMQQGGWRRGAAVDNYEPDAEVYHKAMRYRKKYLYEYE